LAFALSQWCAAQGSPPPLATVEAYARASGNHRVMAVRIGKTLFKKPRSAQILKVYVDGFGRHEIAGLMLSGVKFHRPLNRTAFVDEVVGLVQSAFGAAPVEEVDLWCVVPLAVGKGVIVSGDLAQPTNRTVFTVTTRRGESVRALRSRILSERGVYWDSKWTNQALLPSQGCNLKRGKCQGRYVP